MYYKKNLIILLTCLLFVTHVAHGSYINSGSSYIANPSYAAIPITIPTENPITKYPLLGKNKEIPDNQLYTKFVKKIIRLEDFYYDAPGKKITCPTSPEEANAILNGHFDGNVDEWSKFLNYCRTRYSMSYELVEKKLPEMEGSFKKNQIEELRSFYNYMTSDYIIKNSLEQYFNNLVTLWNQANQNSINPKEMTKTDIPEVTEIITNYGIKETEEHIFKFMQYLGYYNFFAYILSDNFTDKCTVDAKLFEKIVMSAQINIAKLQDKKEIFTDLLALFRTKLKEKKYVLRDKRREIMEIFMITCQEETNKLVLNLEKQATEYMQKAERIQTELEKTKIQFKQGIDAAESEKTNLASKVTALKDLLEEQEKKSSMEQRKSQDKIEALEKQNKTTESDKKKLQTTVTVQEERNDSLDKELNKLKKKAEDFERAIKLKDESYKMLNEINIRSEEQLGQKIKELDAAIKQVELLKQQNEAAKKQQIELEQQLKQKTRDQDVATKQAGIIKQQNEEVIAELKKANQQLRQQLEQQTKEQNMAAKQKVVVQPQPIKKPKITASIDDPSGFFNFPDQLQEKK